MYSSCARNLSSLKNLEDKKIATGVRFVAASLICNRTRQRHVRMVYNPLRRSAQDMRSTCFTAIVTAQLSYSEVGASDDGQNQLSVIVCAINHQSIIIQHVSSSLLVYVGIQSPRVTFIGRIGRLSTLPRTYDICRKVDTILPTLCEHTRPNTAY